MTRFLLGVAIVGVVLAQAPPTAPTPPPVKRQAAGSAGTARSGRDRTVTQGPPGSIRGQVIGMSGEPIRKAAVVLSGLDNFSAVSDSNGSFTISQIPAGSYSIGARRAGYARGTDRNRTSFVTVASGQETSGVVIRLTPQATIAGKVVDEDGDVLMDANVQVLRETWQKGRKTISAVEAATVNDLGEFRVAGLTAGRYYLTVATGRRGRTEPAAAGYAPMYYPGVFDPAQAQPTELLAGQEMRLDMRMRKVATYKIKGRVVDSDPAAQSRGLAVFAVQQSSAGVFLNGNQFARVQNDGWFELAGVTPGTYIVQAARMDRGSGSRAGASIQVGNRDVENIILQLQPPVKAGYSVRAEGDGALDTSGVKLSVETEPGYEMGSNVRAEAGSVLLPAYGRLRLSAQGLPEGTFVKSIRLGSLDVTQGYFDAGASSGAIEVLLGRGAGQASGSVQTSDAKPMGGAFVVLAPPVEQRSDFWRFRAVTADGTGNFSFKNLPPGEYSAFALKDNRDGAYQDPDFLKSIESRGTRVKLSEGGNEIVALKSVE